MNVILDRKRLEAPLPNVPGGPVATSMPLDVTIQESLHPRAQVTILTRPEDEMEVIWHQTESEHAHFDHFTGSLEGT
jgi:hypothetical protein